MTIYAYTPDEREEAEQVEREEKEMTNYEIDKIAFESKQPDRGYTARASYLKPPYNGNALIEILKDGKPLRSFMFPAYKIWNIAAHFSDIVDGEIENNAHGYEMAAWDGISGATIITGYKP